MGPDGGESGFESEGMGCEAGCHCFCLQTALGTHHGCLIQGEFQGVGRLVAGTLIGEEQNEGLQLPN